MMGGDGGGDCGGGDWISAGGDGSGDGAGASHPTQPNPLDDRPKINGEPVTDSAQELVIKKNNAQD